MPVPSSRFSALDLINASAERARTAIDDSRVNRVLNLLSEQYLATAAAEQSGTAGLLTIESVDLPYVWEDGRVVARVAELKKQQIAVESLQIEKEVAGMRFKCWAIQVRY